MTRNDLVREIESILQRKEPLSEDTEIKNIREWDSLAAVSIIAFFDEKFSVNFDDDAFGKLKTIKDVLDVVGDKLT